MSDENNCKITELDGNTFDCPGGNIYQKNTMTLLVKGLREPILYGETLPQDIRFIHTFPFSASLKIDGPKTVVYNYDDKFYKHIKHDDCEKLTGHSTHLDFDNCNPDYAFHFIKDMDDGFYYIIGITDRKTEAQLSQDRFEFVAGSLISRSLPEGVYASDFTGVRIPQRFNFRTFDEAQSWVRGNHKSLILTYSNGFALELTTDSLEFQSPPPEAA